MKLSWVKSTCLLLGLLILTSGCDDETKNPVLSSSEPAGTFTAISQIDVTKFDTSPCDVSGVSLSYEGDKSAKNNPAQCRQTEGTITESDVTAEVGSYRFHATGKELASVQIITKETSSVECVDASGNVTDKGIGTQTKLVILALETPWSDTVTCHEMIPFIVSIQIKTAAGEVLGQKLEQLK